MPERLKPGAVKALLDQREEFLSGSLESQEYTEKTFRMSDALLEGVHPILVPKLHTPLGKLFEEGRVTFIIRLGHFFELEGGLESEANLAGPLEELRKKWEGLIDVKVAHEEAPPKYVITLTAV